MMQRGFVPRAMVLIVPALMLLLGAAACGGGGEEASPTAAATTTAAGAKIDISGVPELKDGKLQVGSDIAYAPIEFYKEGTQEPDGLDIDLAKALAKALGVEPVFVNTGFDGIIPALKTKDFDVIMSAMTVTDERKKEIDFVEYANVGTGVLVPKGNPKGIKTVDDLCGLTVAVQAGTIQLDLVTAQNDKCSKKINIVTFDTNPLAVEDLKTGGADVNLSDFPVAFVDAEQSGGKLEVLDVQIEPEPYGIGVRKESTALKQVLEQALKQVRASGEYDSIMAKWKLSAAALP